MFKIRVNKSVLFWEWKIPTVFIFVTAIDGYVFNITVIGRKSYSIINTDSNWYQSDLATNGKQFDLKCQHMATVLRCVFFFIHLKHFLISVLRHQCVNLSKSLFPDGTKARKSRSKRTHRTNWKWFRFTHKPLKDKYFKQFARHQKGNVSVNWRWFKCQKKCSIVKKKISNSFCKQSISTKLYAAPKERWSQRQRVASFFDESL